MNKEKINEIKKEDKKALHKFAIIILLSLLTGLLIGGLSNMISNGMAVNIADNVLNFLKGSYPVANIVLTVIFMLPVIYLYTKCRKLYQLWDGEREEEMNEIETGLSYGLWFTSILLILSFFFFAAGAYFSVHFSENINTADLIYWFAGFILAVVCTIVSQQKIVNFQKEMNPEKRGSIFDQKFAKEWEESCDEAEQLRIYKAAYTSFRAVTVACLALWVFCVVGANIWDFGLMPVAVISIIWLVQVSSYCIKSISQSKYLSK